MPEIALTAAMPSTLPLTLPTHQPQVVPQPDLSLLANPPLLGPFPRRSTDGSRTCSFRVPSVLSLHVRASADALPPPAPTLGPPTLAHSEPAHALAHARVAREFQIGCEASAEKVGAIAWSKNVQNAAPRRMGAGVEEVDSRSGPLKRDDGVRDAPPVTDVSGEPTPRRGRPRRLCVAAACAKSLHEKARSVSILTKYRGFGGAE
jgi:hypothetical protein